MTDNEQIEEMASAVRERTVVCNKCEYYKEGSCLKPVDLGCNDNEDILNLCDAIYENGYRKASEVAREIFEEIDKRFEALLKFYPCNGEFENAKKFVDFHWKYIKNSIMSDYKEGTTDARE